MLPLLCLLLPLAAGQVNPNDPNNMFSGSRPRVTITELPVDPDRVQPASKLDWTAPTSGAVYCIGSEGVTYLRFTCPECNSTRLDRELETKRKDMTSQLGYKAIVIDNIYLNRTWNGNMLTCEGQYSDSATQETAVVEATAALNIMFLEKPLIVNANGEGPVSTSQGNRFYLQRGGGGSMQLKCQAEGNPTPNQFVWMKDGLGIGKGQSFSVGQALIDESISCSVISALEPAGKESSAVKISPWDTPRLLESNLAQQSIVRSNPNVFQGTSVEISKVVKMNCIAMGNPKPEINWLMQSNDVERVIRNATCTSSQVILDTPGGRPYVPKNGQPIRNMPNTVYVVQSECSVTVGNYSYAGSYWCSACNKVSASTSHCEPAADRPATPNVAINVVGKPMRANEPPSAVQESDGATVSSYYCADPKPDARQVYWTVGGQRVNIGASVGSYKADQPQQNGTSCYTARLRISPLTEEDLSKPIALSVQNRYGTERVPVDLRSLIASESEVEPADIGLIVGLTLGILLFLCLVIPACMWWRGLACFSGPRKTPPEKYASNVAPEHVRSEPTPNNGYNPQNDSSGSSFSPYGGVYKKGPVAPGAERETLSYAAMDLVAEPPAGGRPAPPPVDYTYQQQPHNSVV